MRPAVLGSYLRLPELLDQQRLRSDPPAHDELLQFREIEFLSGVKDARYLDRLGHATDAERARLESRLDEPSLWDAFVDLLAAAGFAVGTVERRRAALLTVSATGPPTAHCGTSRGHCSNTTRCGRAGGSGT